MVYDVLLGGGVEGRERSSSKEMWKRMINRSPVSGLRTVDLITQKLITGYHRL